nr:MAG TPA: hypothetical protein [Caudoviricetes sp.]
MTPNERSFSVVNAVKHCRNDRIVNLKYLIINIYYKFGLYFTGVPPGTAALTSLTLRSFVITTLYVSLRFTSSFVLFDFIIYYLFLLSISLSIQINKFQHNSQLNREEINSQV